MESKNVKVIDEHSIDRNANIICGIDVDGSNYVLYSIERDSDNDNVFVSKLLKNNDGTSSMMNIDDSMEKGKLNDVTKELITYAINSESDKTTGSVTLTNGKEVKIFPVLFNREQNINITKTYISTVKKSVTKVSNMYYRIEQKKVDETPIVESIFEPVVEPAKTEAASTPVMEPIVSNVTTETLSMPVSEPVVEIPVVNTASEHAVDIDQAMPENSTPVSTVSEVVSVPVSNVENMASAVNDVAANVVSSANSTIPSDTFSVSAPTYSSDLTLEKNVSASPIEEIVANTSSPIVSSETPVISDSAESNLSESPLVFDASKETNLNVALGEVVNDKTVPVSNVEAIREFGVDDAIVNEGELPVNEISSNDSSKVLVKTKTMGFANNKFFMVVAITFFIASCVFLGYEVFRYFSLSA